jgi:hypothetical protein
MRTVIVVALAVATTVGCGEARQPQDNTALFIRCLQQHGGERITSPAQLRSYPSSDVERVAAVEFPSVAYDSIDAAPSPHGPARRALVFVEDVNGNPASPAPPELLREARRGRAPARALVLMPPAKDPERQIGRCEDRATRGHDYYD